MSFSWQSVARSVIYFNFKKNQQELANTVCENKDKPKSCCKAKCYLTKELKKEDTRQNSLPNSLKDKVEKTQLSVLGYLFNFGTAALVQHYAFFYRSNYSKGFNQIPFHPPQVI